MAGPLRKDVQPDMRPKCNNVKEEYPPGPLRKDGQPDMRYAANKKYVAENNNKISEKTPIRITTATDPSVPLQMKDGQPCMRYECNNVKEEYPPGPLRKDGQPDMRYAANKSYVAERGANQVAANKKSAENVKENDMGNMEVKFGLVNARSLITKTDELKKKITKSYFDLCVVTETWDVDYFDLKEALPDGFKFAYQPRKDGRQGGGIAVFYRNSIRITRRSRKGYESFECLDVSLDIGADKDIRLINIYRPPNSDQSEFLYEFSSLLAASNRSKKKLFITGDFNLHVENPNSTEEEFLELIESYGLVQHVKKPTHENHGILDLIMTKPSDLSVKNVRVSKFSSDQKFVQCKIQTEKKKEDIIKKEEEYVAERGANKVTANKESAENVKENDIGNVEVKFGLVNAQSLINKTDELKKKIAKSYFDLCVVTETWDVDYCDLKEVLPEGFKFAYQPRKDGRQGGGIAVFYRNSIRITRRSRKGYESFECLDVSLNIGADRDIRLINIYRPPGNSKVEFLDEFKSLLQGEKRKLLITGDFNLHVENPDPNDRAFLKLIKSHDLKQHVKKPTHEKGGILDLIMTQPSDLSVKDVKVGEYFSDHKFVQCSIEIEEKKEYIFEREE